VQANLGQMIQNLKFNCKYTICNQEWARILRDGLWNYSSRFLSIKSCGAIRNSLGWTQVWANNPKHISIKHKKISSM